jgi:hypothetical protein
VPIGVLLIICCLRYVPRDPDRDGRARPLDLAGMALLGIGALALMLGISYLGEAGASAASPLFVVPVIAGLLGAGPVRPSYPPCPRPLHRTAPHRGPRLRGRQRDQHPVRRRGGRNARARPALRRRPLPHRRARLGNPGEKPPGSVLSSNCRTAPDPGGQFRRATGGADMSPVLQAFSPDLRHVPARGSPCRRWRLRGPADGLRCCL